MLRDYQLAICERVKEAFEAHRSVMMQMPTGTGKTVVLASLVKQYLNRDADCSVLIVAHRIELIEQIGEHLRGYGIHSGREEDKRDGACHGRLHTDSQL